MPQSGNSAHNIIPGANTIDLSWSGSRGVLLFHGFGDTPQTFSFLATELCASGFGVRAPLLPGHGRLVEDFVVSRRHQWLEFARLELTDFKKRYTVVSVIGLSMGAALAAILAAENPNLGPLVLIAPYFGMTLDYRAASMSHWVWGPIAGIVKSNSPNSIHDPVEREKNLGYGVYTGRLLYELWRLARRARLSLPRICIPTLLIQSREDPRVVPSIAERAFASLRVTDKRLVWTEGAGHIITVDYGRERVFEEVRSWLSAH